MDYNILKYGAMPDGITDNAKAIQAAIDAAACAGGGRVVIPAGRFLSGTIRLKSNIELHLQAGAVLTSSLREEDILDFARLFSDDNLDTGWDGGCFLFACNEKNITISGTGTIYGQGDKVFFDDDTDGGYHESPLNVTAFRPRTTFFENIENLTVRDITIQDAAFWTLHMAGCRHVRISDIRILNDVRGANNDGIDPDCCSDVIITGCLVKTGDDAIVIKTTKPMAEKYGACENIVIQNCILYSHDSAIKIGTETHGDIRGIVISDCIVRDCSRGIGIWVRDGATVEDVMIHHITGSVRKYADAIRENGPSRWWGNGEPLFMSATYRRSVSGATEKASRKPGCIRNITADHIRMKAENALFIAGEPEAVISDVTIADVNIRMCQQGTQIADSFDEQPSLRDVYYHQIPAVYLRNASRIRITGQVELEMPYCVAKNPLVIEEACENNQVEVRLA